MRDFTLKSYQSLVQAFQRTDYQFQTFEEWMTTPNEGKTIVLRHDVDELAWNALKMAQLENSLGVRATYYFRVVKQSNVPEVIEQIVGLGHEIGYHYEDLALAEGDEAKAIVIEVNKKEWKLKLSFKKLLNKEERAEFEKYLETEEASTSIGDQFKEVLENK